MQRLALIVGAVVIAVLALIILRPSDEPETPASPPPTQAREPNHEAPPPASARGERRDSRPAPRAGVTARITVRCGQPVDGVRQIRAESGDPVRITVSSPDSTEEIHLHGYDLARPLAPGKPATLRFRADLEGIYPLELHGSGAELAQLRVDP